MNIPRRWRRYLCPECRLPHCIWCGRYVRFRTHQDDERQASREHMIPRSMGGPDAATNIRIACRSCNSARGSRLDWADWHAIERGESEPPNAQRYHLREINVDWRRPAKTLSRLRRALGWEGAPS